jgi:MFS superfamily sulfate permease-like transporter
VVLLDLSRSVELDVQSADALADLAQELQAGGTVLRLAAVHEPAARILRRAGVTPGVGAWPTLDGAVEGAAPVTPPAR